LIVKLAAPSFITWAAGNSAGRNILSGVGFNKNVIRAISYDYSVSYSRPDTDLGYSPAGIGRYGNKVTLYNANDKNIIEKLLSGGENLHEVGGENPSNVKGIIDIPYPYGKDLVNLQSWMVDNSKSIIPPRFALDVYQESLAPDIIARHIDSFSIKVVRSLLGEGSNNKFMGGPDWNKIAPELVARVEQNVPQWYKAPNLVSSGSISTNEGVIAINNTFSYNN